MATCTDVAVPVPQQTKNLLLDHGDHSSSGKPHRPLDVVYQGLLSRC
ncbi:hypothetical protein HMPREF9579_00883 [Cutibacterium acnes HL087PA1]|nr:hypothetical protein HMPREF9579_00883 [Cutibacterium acnes HL087PA1]